MGVSFLEETPILWIYLEETFGENIDIPVGTECLWCLPANLKVVSFIHGRHDEQTPYM